MAWSFYEGERSPPIEHLKEDQTLNLLRNDDESKTAPWSNLLSDYGWSGVDEVDRQLISRLERGYFGRDLKSTLTQREAEFAASDRAKKVSAAWDLYHASFDDNENEIVQSFVDAVNENRADITPSSLDEILRVLRGLGRNEVADKMAQDWVSYKGDQVGADFYDARRHGGYRDLSDPRLVTLFSERKAALTAPMSLVGELRRLVETDSWNDERLAFLAGHSVADYEELFRSLRGEELTDLIRASLRFEQISNASELMKEIVSKSRAALWNIASDNRLNRWRMNKFGVRPEDSGA